MVWCGVVWCGVVGCDVVGVVKSGFEWCDVVFMNIPCVFKINLLLSHLFSILFHHRLVFHLISFSISNHRVLPS